MPGTIRLEYKDERIDSLSYKFPKRRKEIIDNWKERYGKKFNECVLIIIPDTENTKVKSDGRNWHSPSRKRKKK